MANTTSFDVRSKLVHTLQLDLVGPGPGDEEHFEEVLPQAPSRWYLSGFLVPYEAAIGQRSDDISADAPDLVERESGCDDETTPEQASARRAFFPSSIGISFLLPPQAEALTIDVEWGDYAPLPKTEPAEKSDIENSEPESDLLNGCWKRIPRRESVQIPLSKRLAGAKTTEQLLITGEPTYKQLDLKSVSGRQTTRLEVPGSGGLNLVVSVRPVSSGVPVPPGTRSASVFLVNNRPPTGDGEKDLAFIFQAGLKVACSDGFVPRPNPRGRSGDDADEQVADLQFRDVCEYASGHNISAVSVQDEDEKCQRIATIWLPTAEVEKVIATSIPGIELGIEALAAAKDYETIHAMLGNLAVSYEHWIVEQGSELPEGENRRQVALKLLNRARVAKRRIEEGIQALADPLVLEAFRIANRAIARYIRQRASYDGSTTPEEATPPQWRPFQLAFILMNMPGIAKPDHPDREVVDLLFFPTGGGKTEAYLGLAAFTLVLRRLKNPTVSSAGLAVLMRYTLRLLTLDQLGRAAALVCALELERQANPAKLGPWPFEIGLWVGQAATPNRMGKKGDNDSKSARARTIAFQNDDRKPSPIPLETCPWCNEKFRKESFQLLPDAVQPTQLRVGCLNRKRKSDGIFVCPFRADNPLPVLAVDDQIYQRLPCFIIATVDKFASLPWVGHTGALFGKVERYDANGFYGPMNPNAGSPLPSPLPPPELIVQDELHLISGPLGTMVGLYETAIDVLSSAKDKDGKTIRPKIVASTATVRRAERQIRALFGRTQVDVFPPPGPNRRDSFFAKTVSTTERHGRLYVGVAAQGRSLKVVLLRVYLAMMGAAIREWKLAGGARNPANPADPYTTLLGYFNALRELGGSRRIVEDEVKSRLGRYGLRRRVGEAEGAGLFADRVIGDEPAELTSRVSTNQVADTKRRLDLPYSDKDHVDVALATNMISVGLDIVRLGLMVVLGQPKTASEYIQATSRVGRDEQRPGLVITLMNVHRPRDRSHYERFAAYHESFYRAVEATSVTPFSPRAVDRGLAAITVALARLGDRRMTAPAKAHDILTYRKDLDFVVDAIARRAEEHDGKLDGAASSALRSNIRSRVVSLLDDWVSVAHERGDVLQYQREVGQAPPLLFDPLDPELEKLPSVYRKFKAGRSLRDVEPTVNLWIRNVYGQEVQGEED